MTPDRRAVCDRVLGYAALVDAACAPRGLDRWLVLAIIARESLGESLAWRPEPQFLERYRDGILRSLNAAGVALYLKWWMRDPLVLATSFGLMQQLVISAIERGMVLDYPTRLCDPAVGIESGCRQLRWLGNQVPGGVAEPVRALLLRWNGGASLEYPNLVLGWRDDVMEAARG